MARHIYRSKAGPYILADNRAKTKAGVHAFFLRKAHSRQGHGLCVTLRPLNVWTACPRQVFGFASEDGRERLHVGGWGNPWAPDDYADDYYELLPWRLKLRWPTIVETGVLVALAERVIGWLALLSAIRRRRVA